MLNVEIPEAQHAVPYGIFREFVEEEPQYDRRGELYPEGAYGGIEADLPLTTYWSALTFDEAINVWSNADDDHIGVYLDRQRAVLDAFADWVSEEREGDYVEELPPVARPVVELRRQGYTAQAIATQLGMSSDAVGRVLQRFTEVSSESWGRRLISGH